MRLLKFSHYSSALEDLISAVQENNPEIKNFDCSCFNGEYITGGVDEEFLQNLHKTR